VFNGSAMNFNPLAAMAGRICVLEAEQIVEPGEIPPVQVQLPGVHVHRVIEATVAEKRIERRTVRPRAEEGV
jgi:3-oxoacid CoA-transferase subunit A